MLRQPLRHQSALSLGENAPPVASRPPSVSSVATPVRAVKKTRLKRRAARHGRRMEEGYGILRDAVKEQNQGVVKLGRELRHVLPKPG